MKQMKSKFFAVLLVCVLAGMLGAAAPAWAYPKWIGIKGKLSIERNDEQKDPNSGTYKRYRFIVTYTNNSKDKIVTAIFNKTINLTCDLHLKNGNKIANDKKGLTSTKVNKCELWPGQSISLHYYPLLDISHWKNAAERKRFNTNEIVAKNLKWTHDFQVRTEDL